MKITNHIITALFLAIGFSAKADQPVFGNSPNGYGPAFNLGATGGGEAFGGAVAFTPDQTISLTSVTLSLSGYTGQDNQNFYVEICNNLDPYGNGVNQPGSTVANLFAPAPNDGSTAEFTFTDSSGPISLNVGQEYWLYIYGNAENVSGEVISHWMSGGSPVGNAVFDEAESYNTGSFNETAATPAFTLNTAGPTDDTLTVNSVPEPGVDTLMIISFFALFGYARARRLKEIEIKSAQLVPVKK